ncbi:hypothetical protein AMEX_G256 [Astyanax mexicanus]|uniref:PHD-type domain-containing protein n=3 Tax=Astyanax mexicanus TaxID=7994 RepID=A0A8T2M157_ASTMX|nr:hypothetical protein AMEX_G26823 [Astyanax mexicanus]KAG9275326.1 hypothetical protein AMEX_G9827 [Astyanax mexicanus]KAG9281702.1 hypothetical protein AMEX_G256 [Astyanax mexicanus]
MEIHLTQTIMKECDTKFYKMPGYIQHYQVNPFGVHMYSETGISILVQHLRRKDPVTLYLDATGGVVSKIPNQAKRVLYYSLTLAGKGRDAPPVPVCEMLTNEHSVPPITFWLMKFTLDLAKYTQIRVRQVETDFSWALIQSALLAFNKEHILSYLDRAHTVCRGEKTWAEIRQFTVLHLCAAHILKAVTQAIGRQTEDKGLKEFATFVFARLQNATSLEVALDIFRSFCFVLLAERKSRSVKNNLNVLEDIISKSQVTLGDTKELEQHCKIQTCDSEEEKSSAKTIMGRSPFSKEFQQVLDMVKVQVANEKSESSEDNPYYCPGIIKILFDSYLGLFPMWSGLLLGNLKRYSSDEKMNPTAKHAVKTRDTNCHVERWFGIVKQSILGKRKYIRPGAFIRKMHCSLQARFIEHIMQNNLSQELLLKPLPPKSISHSQETWAKREEANSTTTKSKYFSAPQSVPLPQGKKKKGKEKKSCGKDADGKGPKDVSQNKPCMPADEVETLWKNDPTDLVVSILRAPDKKLEFLLRQREFQTLRPHEWIAGEAIESYFRTILNHEDTTCRLFQLSHYTTGVVLYGTREQCARQSLRNVNFEAYDGVISFVNVKSVHWRFVYIHALSKEIFVLDPQRGCDEMEEARQAARKFGQYFKMRHNQHGREDWVNIQWKPATIQHTFQRDGVSCGVFVMQMAKSVVEEFPRIPQIVKINPTKKQMCQYRGQMALDILRGSVLRDEYCSVCGLRDLPQSKKTCVWIQCERCQRWFHLECLKIAIPAKDVQWFCVLCLNPADSQA